MSPPTWLVAAPRSGAGKTTVTLGLAAALRRRGLAVHTAKAGPDYIDPAFLAAASGAPSVNLDSWAMPPPLLDRLFARAQDGADILLVESAMGLFDGVAGKPDGVAGKPGRTGSAADLARRFGIPVLLVLDVSGQAQTAAAVAHGLAHFDPAVRIGGVILNRVGSDKHRRAAAALMRQPVLGAIPRDATLGLPERHLGLVQAGEHAGLTALLDTLANTLETSIDLDRLLLPLPLGEGRGEGYTHDPDIGAAPHPTLSQGERAFKEIDPPGQRIALARDAAFTFLYPHLLTAWREAGAEIFPFSPLADEAPPDAADCCWLPGGYPELHAAALAAATGFLDGLRAFAATRPVHGECGGYMVLGRTLTDADGTAHPMAGLLDHATSFARRKLHLGYRRATLSGGATVRGHEFHYATVIDPGADAPYARITDAAGAPLGPAGGRRGHVAGSFFHAIAAETE